MGSPHATLDEPPVGLIYALPGIGAVLHNRGTVVLAGSVAVIAFAFRRIRGMLLAPLSIFPDRHPPLNKIGPIRRPIRRLRPHIPELRIGRLWTVLNREFVDFNQNRDRCCPTEQDTLARRKTGQLGENATNIVRDKPPNQLLVLIIDDAVEHERVALRKSGRGQL